MTYSENTDYLSRTSYLDTFNNMLKTEIWQVLLHPAYFIWKSESLYEFSINFVGQCD